MLAFSVADQPFRAVPGRHPQILQRLGGVQKQELSVRPALHVHWKPARGFAEEYLLGLSIPEARDHARIGNDSRR